MLPCYAQLLKYSRSHNSEHLLLHIRNHSPRNRIRSACCSFLLAAIWSHTTMAYFSNYEPIPFNINVITSLHGQSHCIDTKETKTCFTSEINLCIIFRQDSYKLKYKFSVNAYLTRQRWDLHSKLR